MLTPDIFCKESPNYLLSTFLESAIYQKFQRLHFLINLSEIFDADREIITDFREEKCLDG